MIYKKELTLILLVKVFFTFFAVFIYNHFSHLADSERYLNAVVDFNNFLDRTQFVDNIFAFLRYIMLDRLLVNIFISILFGFSFFFFFCIQRPFLFCGQAIIIHVFSPAQFSNLDQRRRERNHRCSRIVIFYKMDYQCTI